MAVAQLAYNLTCWSPQGLSLNRVLNQRWSAGTGDFPVQQRVTLNASSFTALTVPTGATFVCLVLGDAVSLTLKGITGDTGIALTPAANPLGLDAMFPVSSPSLGIANGSGSPQTISVIWL